MAPDSKMTMRSPLSVSTSAGIFSVGVERDERGALLLLLREVDEVHLVRKLELGEEDGDLLAIGVAAV